MFSELNILQLKVFMLVHTIILLCVLLINCTSCVGVDGKKIDECIGDIEADVDNPILKAEQEAQVR